MLYYNRAFEFEHEDPAFVDQPTFSKPNEAVASALLDGGAAPDETDPDGTNAVFWAARFHHDVVLNRLATAGCRVNLKVGDDETPLYVADAEGAKTLIEHGATVNQIQYMERDVLNCPSLFGQYAETAKPAVLLDHGAPVESPGLEDWTPLYNACWCGEDGTVLVLLQHHANFAYVDSHGFTPLLCAARSCRQETVQALVKAGASLKSTGWQGSTALMLSIDNSDQRVFHWLLDSGIDVNARGLNGNTALTNAMQRLSEETGGNRRSEVPVARRYPINEKARSIAGQARFKPIIATLRAHGAKQIPRTSDWFYPEDP